MNSRNKIVNDSRDLARAYQSAPVALAQIDDDLRLLLVNDRFAALSGLSPASVRGQFVQDVLPTLAGQLEPAIRQVFTSGAAAEPVEIRGQTQETSGRVLTWLQFVTPFHGSAGEIAACDMALVDITVQKEHELEKKQLLQEIQRERDNALRQERHRIAVFLHDEVQQVLFGVQTQLTLLRQQAPDSLDNELMALEQHLNDTIDETRALSTELDGPDYGEAALDEALEILAATTRERHGLQVRIQVLAECHDAVLSQEVQEVLLRVLSELLFNIVKHADVESADLLLQCSDNWLTVTVRDQGKGFEPGDASDKSNGFGLPVARRQIRVLGGSLNVESEPAAGTNVIFRLPLEPSHP